jgi:hypothetical protein
MPEKHNKTTKQSYSFNLSNNSYYIVSSEFSDAAADEQGV